MAETATILNVNDREVPRYTISQMLRRAGFGVVEAATGAEALARARQGIDLVVLDVKLPDLDGYEVCRRLKADPATAAIAVLQTSAALVRVEDRVEGLDSGADTYLAQPFDAAELVATVRALLRVRAAERRAHEALRSEEQVQLRLHQLLEISEALAGVPSFDDAVQALGRNVVPLLADYLVVYLNNGAGALTLNALFHGDPEKEQQAREVHRRFSLPNVRWARPGQMRLALQVSDETLRASSFGDPELLETLREMEMRSSITVPMELQDRVLGALTFVLAGGRPTRAYSELDVAFFQDIARRAAGALENARNAEFRERLLGIVSHDLRNPLASIVLSANRLVRAEDLPEKHVKSVRRVLTGADRMSRMISDLMDFTSGRLGGGIPVARSETDLSQVARQVVEELESTYPHREVQLTAPPELRGLWDADRLAQLLVNLGKNALDYSPEGSTVEVTVRSVDGTAQVELRNRNIAGPIPPEQLATLFAAFRRGSEGQAQQRSGLGLGLYIAQQIAQSHGGAIRAESNADGTVFTVELPTAPPQPESRPPQG